MNDNLLLLELMRNLSYEEIEAAKLNVHASNLGALLHTFLCSKDHETECDYYVEEVSTIKSEAREVWKETAKQKLSAAGINTSLEAEIVLRRFPAFLSLIKDDTTLLKFLIVLLLDFEVVIRAHGSPSPGASGPSNSVECSEE